MYGTREWCGHYPTPQDHLSERTSFWTLCPRIANTGETLAGDACMIMWQLQQQIIRLNTSAGWRGRDMYNMASFSDFVT